MPVPAASIYFLPTDLPERDRLNIQHDLFKQLFDNKIIYAPVDLHADSAVLDCGTGTAIWISELASQLKGAQFIGIDVSSALFPETHPSSVSLHKGSVLELPSDLDNTFDLVNQRLLVGAFLQSQWRVALTALVRVTKPGGWLQLIEPGHFEWPDLPASKKIMTVYQALLAFRGMASAPQNLILSLMEELGLRNITLEERSQPLGSWAGPTGELARDNMCGVYQKLGAAMIKAGGFGVLETREDYNALIEEMRKEWNRSEGLTQTWAVMYAQKPRC